MRQICETLGFNKSTLYYQPKKDPCEDVLRDEIEQLAARYPTYGYRRITKLLVNQGYTVGYRRVARLMKAENLCVAVKRACQTTHSIDGVRPWGNRLKTLDICRRDQVWVGDITYVRLKGHFIYVCLLMDVFTRMIRGWHISQHLTQSLTLTPLQRALRQSGFSRDSSQRSRRSISFKCLPLDAQASWDRDFRSTSRVSLGERVCSKTHPHTQGGRSSPQRLQGCHGGERSHRAFSVSSRSRSYRITATNLSTGVSSSFITRDQFPVIRTGLSIPFCSPLFL